MTEHRSRTRGAAPGRVAFAALAATMATHVPATAAGDAFGGVDGATVEGAASERAVAGDDAAVEGAVAGQVVAPSADAAVRRELVRRWRGLGEDHVPRTEHLLPDGSPKYVNRLVGEASPYLLQHAHNPVDWMPWGEEAFARAAVEDKPVFLSIGYATCHWCHVMERESFEDEAIAGFMNEHFVAVKVDREQLPDVDALYMTAVQMLTGGGGWPMSSFLDTEARPFHGGTYIPPDRFRDLLDRVSRAWATEHDALLAEAARVGEALGRANRLAESAREVGEAEVGAMRALLVANRDPEHGGFGRAPKFPQESTLLFLLDQARRTGGGAALETADAALRAMAAGGIHDQVGGGFHRYAVDARWRVPHFEKMLYNQAGLARAYALGWRLTGNPDHAETARGILDYVLREMTAPEGTFHSATDADSEGREGAFFVWTEDDLAAALGATDAALAAELWGVDGIGNFEVHEHPGQTVLHRPEPLAAIAARRGLSVEALRERRAALATRLREARGEREPPLRDDKVLTGWNGLMITAFAEAGTAFDEPRYLEAARRAADALWGSAWDPEARELERSAFRGEIDIDARQTDHAWLAEAMIALHDADGDARWLRRATLLADTMIARFGDPIDGGFFLGAEAVAGAVLPVRPKDVSDASTPSGNGVALAVLARLFDRAGEQRFADEADALVDAFAGTLAERRGGTASLLTGLAEHVGGGAGSVGHAGRGRVRAEARRVGDGRVEVVLDIAEGWHVNSDAPLQDYLIATALAGPGGEPLVDTAYPEPVERTLAFQSETLSLFEGRATLAAVPPEGAALPAGAAPPGSAAVGATTGGPGATMPPNVTLRLQACSEEVCLAPETLVLEVPRAAPSG